MIKRETRESGESGGECVLRRDELNVKIFSDDNDDAHDDDDDDDKGDDNDEYIDIEGAADCEITQTTIRSLPSHFFEAILFIKIIPFRF